MNYQEKEELENHLKNMRKRINLLEERYQAIYDHLYRERYYVKDLRK